MRRNGRNFFRILLVHFVNGNLLVLLVFRVELALQQTYIVYKFSQRLAVFRVVGYAFGDYILCAVDCVFYRFYALFFVPVIYKVRRAQLRKIALFKFLRENNVRQRLQALFDCDRRASLFLLLVRAVNVFDFGKRLSFFESRGNFVRPLFLRFDRVLHFFFARDKVVKVVEPVGKLAQYLVVARAVHFLAVARDKRYRVTVVDKVHDIGRIFGF